MTAHVSALPNPKDSGWVLDFCLALLIFLPTLFFVPYWVNVLLFLVFLLFASNRIQLKKRDLVLVLFILLGILNTLPVLHHYSPQKHGFLLAIVFMGFSVLIGRSFNLRTITYLLNFTIFEGLVVIVEMASGHRYFFEAQERASHASGETEGLLYFFRPLGLSENSSAIAFKLMIGLILLLSLWKHIHRPKTKVILLAVAFILTFNRTAIGGLVFFSAWLYADWLWSIRRIPRIWIKHMAAWMLAAGAILAVIGDLIFQFTRGSSDISQNLSGRPFIWAETFQFIREHPIFGNHSLPFRTQSIIGNVAHAHNSFFQIYATHGLLSLLLLAYPLLFLKWRNLPFIATLFLCSLTQYTLFWNFSYMDTMMYFFLSASFMAMDPNPGSLARQA